MDNLRTVAGIQNFFFMIWRNAESNDNTVYLGFDFGLAIPTECTIRKVNVNTGSKKRFPEISYAFSL